MSKPIFVRKTKNYGEIMPHYAYPNLLICVWRRKITRWFEEVILLPSFGDVPVGVARDVAEGLYMAANYAADIANKRRFGKNAGMPGLPVNGGLQVFRHDPRWVIGIVHVAAMDGGGMRIRIPGHGSLDIPSAVQFANVILQACDEVQNG